MVKQLLLAQGNQAYRQWDFWDLIAGSSFWKCSSVVLVQTQGNQDCREWWEPWDLFAGAGYQEPGQLL
jgi:hypothetical protein